MLPEMTIISFSYDWPRDYLRVLINGPNNPGVYAEAPWSAWMAWRMQLVRGMLMGHCPEGHLLFPLPGVEVVHVPDGDADTFMVKMGRMMEEASQIRGQGSRLHLQFIAETLAKEPPCTLALPAVMGWRQLA